MTLFSSRSLLIAATVFSLSAVAQAQDMPAPAGAPAPDLVGTADKAISGLAEKASALGSKVMPENLAIPGLEAVLPAKSSAPPPQANDPNITQGQDRSVKVASEGKPESIFFTPNQLASIMRAKEGYLAPKEAYEQTNQEDPVTSGTRVISLAGIVYVNKNNWVIWLNGERVTRKNMPQRLVGLSVTPSVVHLRWMDIPNQRVVNITLKPHQQYLLDSDTIIPIPGA